MPKLQDNRLIAALPKAEADRLLPGMYPAWLWPGQTLVEKGGRYQNAYFPTTALVSLVYEEPDFVAEVAVIGNDGVVGIPLFLSDGMTAYRAVVRSPGYAYRLDEQLLRREFERGESFRGLLLRYTLSCLCRTGTTSAHHEAKPGY